MLQTPLFLLISLFIFSSCGGYQFVENDNPLAIHGIRSVSVPMFVNKSPLPNIGSMVTKEIVFLLSGYPGLRVQTGEDLKSDAILVGIVEGEQHLSDLMITTERKFTSAELKDSIGSRREFYVPTGTSMNLKVRFVLIKNPNRSDIDLTKGELAPLLGASSKVLVNQTLDLNANFNRVVGETTTVNSPGLVNMTKNKAIMERALQDGSKSLAAQFKDVVLNAF